MTPGQRLAVWRKKNYPTQTAAAAALGVSQGAWSEWEADKKPPSLDLAFKLEAFTKGYMKARMWAKPHVPTSKNALQSKAA